MTFKKKSALHALGGDVKKMPNSREEKNVHMVGNISGYINVLRAARSWGRC